jgi:hypothetical protein
MDDASGLSMALAVLSAMITPAVLISACGTLALSTSNRLARSLDRTRSLSQRFRAYSLAMSEGRESDEDPALLYELLDKSIKRTLILHRALTSLYLALVIFILTSVVIGIITITGERFTWLPIVLSLGGAGFLVYASAELVHETHVGRASIVHELDVILREGRERAPQDILAQYQRPARRRIF